MRTQILSPSGMRPQNLYINGAMDLWQRVAGNPTAIGTATPTVWTADRFSHHTAGPTAKSFTALRSTTVPSAALVGTPPPYSLQVNCLTTVSVLNAADRWFAYRAVVEDKDLLEAFALGSITFAFEFQSTTAGIYPCRIYNFGTNRSYVTTFSYTTPGVWQQIVVSFPLEATIGHIGFYINHDGSTFQTTPNAWVAGDFSTPTGGGFVNLYSSGLTMRMTNFGAYAGKVYPMRNNFYTRGKSLGEELALAQRYFEKTYNLDVPLGTITTVGAHRSQTGPNGLFRGFVTFKTQKRAPPGVFYYNSSTGALGQFQVTGVGGVVMAGAGAGEHGLSWENVGTSVNTDCFVHWAADVEI